MINWRKLFKIFGARVAVTRDFDGDIRYRFIYKDPFGGLRCRKVYGFIHLNDDGTCSNGYVEKWKEI